MQRTEHSRGLAVGCPMLRHILYTSSTALQLFSWPCVLPNCLSDNTRADCLLIARSSRFRTSLALPKPGVPQSRCRPNLHARMTSHSIVDLLKLACDERPLAVHEVCHNGIGQHLLRFNTLRPVSLRYFTLRYVLAWLSLASHITYKHLRHMCICVV